MDWDLVSSITGNRIRFRVLISLKIKSKTPTAISKDTGYALTHVSTQLKNLEGKGLVLCLTPKIKKNKFFSITESGKELLKEINKNTDLPS